MEFPDILLSVPPESLSKFPCSAVSGKLATAAKRLTAADECRAEKLMMVFAATYYLLSGPHMHSTVLSNIIPVESQVRYR